MASKKNDLDMVQLLLSKGEFESEEIKNNYTIFRCAVPGGNLKILEYLKEKGFALSGIDLAALKGNREIIEWFLNNGYISEFDDETMVAASKYGDLEQLKWLRKLHFQCGIDTFAAAAV
jgi:kynurenine formamidase